MAHLSDRIVVSGYYGFANTGDEAILASLVEHLGRIGELVVLSANPSQTTLAHGVRAIGRTDVVAISRELSGAALFVSGGGGLLQDTTGLKSVPYYATLLKAAQWRGVPTMLLGAGVGPLRAVFSRAVAASAVRHCRVCAVRDDFSADLLRQLGVSARSLAVTADPALVLSPAPDEALDAKLAAADLDLSIPTIGVAIRPWPTWYERQFKSFSATLAQVARSVGAQILVIPFQRPHDERITQELFDCLQFRPGDHLPATRLWTQPLAPREMRTLLSRCHLVVGMRLHALILAAAGAVPFMGVSYDPKVASFGQRFDMPIAPGVEDLEDTSYLFGVLMQLWERREDLAERMRAALPRERELALRNFELAEDVARRKGDLQRV